MNNFQIMGAILLAYFIGYGHGRNEGEVRIQANAPVTCTTDGKVVTCK